MQERSVRTLPDNLETLKPVHNKRVSQSGGKRERSGKHRGRPGDMSITRATLTRNIHGLCNTYVVDTDAKRLLRALRLIAIST